MAWRSIENRDASWSRQLRHAFQVVEGIKTRAVPVSPHRLDRVAACDGAAHELKRRRRERLVGRLVHVTQNVHLTLASRAWTMAPESFQRDETLASVVPLDGEFISDWLNVSRTHDWLQS